MKKLMILIFILMALLSASCSQGPKGSAKFTFKLSFVTDSEIAPSKFKVFAEKSGERREFNVVGSEAIITLPVGIWNFYSVEWNGAAPYTGAIRCGNVPAIELKSGIQATVDFAQTEAKCGDAFFKTYFNNYCYEAAASTGTSTAGIFRSGDGSSTSPYEICSVNQLNAIGANLNVGNISYAYYKLARDINFHAKFVDITNALPFTMIGSPISSVTYNATSLPFTGTIDGQGYAIKGMRIKIDDTVVTSTTTVAYLGFVRNMTGGTIKNIHFYVPEIWRDSSSATSSLVGIVAGSISSTAVIDNVHVHYGHVEGTTDVGGLVGQMGSGTIQNSSYRDGDVSGFSSVGGIAGSSYGGTLYRVFSKGEIHNHSDSTSSGGAFGGIIGLASTGAYTLSESHSAMDISGMNQVGGLVGNDTTSSGSIQNSYSTGDIYSWGGANCYVGGIAGYKMSGGTISKTFHTMGGVSSMNTSCAVGGLFGSYSMTCSDSFSTGLDTLALGCTASGTTASTTYAGIRTLGTFAAWDILNAGVTSTSTWVMDDVGYDYPRLRWEAVRPCSGLLSSLNAGGSGTVDSPYVVCTQTQFIAINSNPNYFYKLGRDIDLGSSTPYSASLITSLGGGIDGAGFALHNFVIEPPSGPAALIGDIASGATVKNLGLKSFFAKSLSSSANALTTYNSGIIDGVKVTSGYMKSLATTGGSAAGLVYSNAGAIRNSRSEIPVEANSVAGLVKSNSGTIYRSVAYGSLTATGSQAQYLGGLAGDNSGFIGQSTSSSHIYVSSTMTGTISEVGGLVGNNMGTGQIYNSFADGYININAGTSTVSMVGGLVGYDGSAGNIYYSFAATSASVTCATDETFGQFVGWAPSARDYTNSTVIKSSPWYWDSMAGSATNTAHITTAPILTAGVDSQLIENYDYRGMGWTITEDDKNAEDDPNAIWVLYDNYPDLVHTNNGGHDLAFYKAILGF